MKYRNNGSPSRHKATRDPIKIIYIYSEGKNTEPDYFNALCKSLSRRVTKVVCKGGQGVPKSVAQAAIEFAKAKGLAKGGTRKRRNLFEQKDEVWAVFDRDEFTCYYDAKQMCKGAKISYAYTDPCFELWLNLHVEDSDAPCTRQQIQKETETLVPGYSSRSGKTTDFSALVLKVAEAEERAKVQRKRREEERSKEGHPSTNVDQLTAVIRNG